MNASVTDHTESPIKPTHHGDTHASPKSKVAENGPAVTINQTSPLPSEPITCEVTASRVPPAETRAPYQEPKVEHVNIKPGRRPAKCCVLV
ncbi:hypothetical protein FGIG_06575 [Fasciola gigantica]|uniref:Uncharacterized protein n=1 Tax=Fasciola gigantica TaxID=46835 RepID=A0A504YXE1_FASGI|nr:hypothetical protein FGIG_06575 [Fasciola gigantica]